jgi:SWI/SNF-related matrix-associated actin-dependent regulator of chromatin subfamily B protein 1
MDRPRKLKPSEADLPEILVPVRLEFDVDQHKFKETFMWNLNGQSSRFVILPLLDIHHMQIL